MKFIWLPKILHQAAKSKSLYFLTFNRSLYEIGYMIMGRASIFWISAIIAMLSFGLMMIYFIVFSQICRSIVLQLAFSNDVKTKNFFASQTFYVLLLASGLLPLVVKKELKELKIASVILFLGVASFILIFTI